MFHFAEARISGVLKGGLYNDQKNIFILNRGTSAEMIFKNADKLPDFKLLGEGYYDTKKITRK